MHTYYVDESGFTGEDLLSDEQPVFALGTTDLSDEEAQVYLDRYFNDSGALEVKHSKVVRSAKGRIAVVNLINSLATGSGKAGVWVSHKEFALVTLIVDWWMEPLAHRHGLNLYEDGANLGMANMLYVSLEGFWNRAFRRRILSHFQRMLRTRTPEFFLECEQFVRKESDKVDGDRAEVLLYFLPSFVLLGMEHVRRLPSRVLDLALPGLFFIGHKWSDRRAGPFELVHDQSSNVAKQKWIWDMLASPDLPPARFENPSGPASFPMNVCATRFADSRVQKQLQICDIVAGAAAACLRYRHSGSGDRAYAESLSAAGIEQLIWGGLWPSINVTPESLGMRGWDGNRAIEWISQRVRQPPHG